MRGGPQKGAGYFGESIKLLILPGIELRFLSSSAYSLVTTLAVLSPITVQTVLRNKTKIQLHVVMLIVT
jgi:hypothetical protein